MKKSNFSNEEYWQWAGTHFKNLGAKGSRKGVLFVWDIKEPELGKGYKWEGAGSTKKGGNPDSMNSDKVLEAFFEYGDPNLNMVAVIDPYRDGKVDFIETGQYENELRNYIKAVVERYDGDGIEDYNSKIKIKYWQAGNEPFLQANNWLNKGGSLESYVKFVEIFAESVRQADPEAKIVLGAEVENQSRVSAEMKTVIELLKNKAVFDVVDIHFWSKAEDYKMVIVQDMLNILNANGHKDTQIFSTEHGTYVNQPEYGNFSEQSETQQATSLIKRYAYNLAHDVDKIFWNNLVEWSCFGGRCGGMFDNMGLISDGMNNGETLATLGEPRLSYYAYKLMTNKLQDSNWNNIEIIQEKDNVYIYKFTQNNNNKSVYVAWWDYWQETDKEQKQISFNLKDSQKVLITETVSNKKSGNEINAENYIDFFNKGYASPKNFNLTLTLGQLPVFIENCPENCGDLNKYIPTINQTTNHQNNHSPQIQNQKCGDGICDPVERKNLKLCPEDCK
jgi:hypothetical protein